MCVLKEADAMTGVLKLVDVSPDLSLPAFGVLSLIHI